MLRILAIAGGFLTITAGLLYFQPGAATDDPLARATPTPQPTPAKMAEIPQAQVSRAGTVLDLVSAAPAPQVAPPAPAPRPVAVAVAVPITNPDSLQSITAGVLADLRATPAVAAAQTATAPGTEFRSMTSGVLASLNAATGATPSGQQQSQGLENLIVQALQQGQSDAYIDALLNEAAATGQVQVPSALVTSDGRVDTVTLLATLVNKSRGQSGVNTSALDNAAGSTPIRPVTRLTNEQVYVVQPGDSLAAISYRFYGETLQYREIFAANQDKLSSPDKIRIGQRLKIPAL